MGFGDLQSRDGLLLLNTFLADKSYIEGFVIASLNFILIFIVLDIVQHKVMLLYLKLWRKHQQLNLKMLFVGISILLHSVTQKNKSRLLFFSVDYFIIIEIDSKVNVNRLSIMVDNLDKIANKNTNLNHSRLIQQRKNLLRQSMMMMLIYSVMTMKNKVNKQNNV